MSCLCSPFDRPDGKVRFCTDHHRYFRDAKELMSVTRLLKSCWPIKPDFSAAPPEVLENARERGSAVDLLISEYIDGRLDRIPAGTRTDAVDLFLKARQWVDAAPGPIQAQRILADHAVAGMCDFLVCGSVIADLKATYEIEAFYPLQLGGYAELYEVEHGHLPEALGILHVTARYAKPRWIPLDVEQCVTDWKILRRCWEMAQGRIRKD